MAIAVHYWAFAANPLTFRIEEALRARYTGLWTTRGRPVSSGDRVVIWKYQGRDRVRGVVALGEVVTNPEMLADPDNPYWLDVVDRA
jgi:hypothetical protein